MMMMEDTQSLQKLSIYQSDVNSVDFAGDYILVTGSGDKRVRVWEWQQGNGYQEMSFSPLLGHKYGVTCVKVSPQSTMLASASIDGTTQLWNLRTGCKIHTMVQVGGESVRVCRFSPDSTFLVTAGDNGQICLWDLVRRTLIRCFQQHEGAVQSVCFTPDSNWLLTTCTFGVLNLFSVGELVDSVTPTMNVYATVDDAHDLGVVCCDFSVQITVTNKEPLEKTYLLATCGNDHYVKLWEIRIIEGKRESKSTIATINLVKTLERHSSALMCVRFNSNGNFIVSSGLDKTAVIWETSSGRVMSVLRGHKRYVACCAFSKDSNLIATGSNDRSVIVWDLTGNLSLDSKLTRYNNANAPSTDDENQEDIDAIQERKVVNFAESANDIQLICTLDDHGGAVNSVAFNGDRMIASVSSDKLVRVWEIYVEEEEEMISSEAEDEENGQVMIKIEKKFREMPYSPIDGHKYSINYVEFSPCGTMLASCSLDGTTIIWDVESGEQARGSFVNSGSGIRVCRWSPNGSKLSTAGDDEKATVWDINTLEELQIFEGHADAVTALAFTIDSLFIATGCSDGTIRFFAVSGETIPLSIWNAHDLGVQRCDFSPTSSPIAGMRQSSVNPTSKCYILATCGNDSLVKLWRIDISVDENGDPILNKSFDEESNSNIINYREKSRFTGHGGNVMDVKFAPIHGEILGSVATDRTARIWSVNSGVCLHVLENHESLVTCCAFSGDTTLFATGALDKTVAVWKLPLQLVSQSILIDRLRNNRNKKTIDWNLDDVVKWLNESDLIALEHQVIANRIIGRTLLTESEEDLIEKLQVPDDMIESFKKHIFWLKQEDVNVGMEISEDTEIPHDFLCPITHEIMREPVTCSDGFIYEKAAISEWFLCGKYSSPMTNQSLDDTSITPAIALREAIYTFFYGEQKNDDDDE